MKRTMGGDDGKAEKALTKLVVDVKSDKVVGVHMVGPEASEILQVGTTAPLCASICSMLCVLRGLHVCTT